MPNERRPTSLQAELRNFLAGEVEKLLSCVFLLSATEE
jgi:hypothetical protein